MANKKSNIEIILSARDLNLTGIVRKGQAALNAFNKEVGGGNSLVSALRSNVLQLAGAFAGLSAISEVGAMMDKASRNAYSLEASVKAANREFAVGSASDWEATISELSNKLKIYSESDIKGATARTIDMTKRLGLNAEQMKKVIELSGDLAAGRTDLEGGVERVTAALRGEAEASEYLGLTLNENYVKAWHATHDAQAKAWKDLTDIEKAQIRYNVFLEQAIPLQGKAAASITTYAGALDYVRATVANSIANNKNLVEALVEVGNILRDNAQDLGAFAAAIATGAGSVIKFVAANREVIGEVLKYGLVFGVATRVIGGLISTWKGLNAAMLVMTGLQIVPWLRSLELASAGVTTAVTGLQIGFVGLMGATAAYFAAYKAGEWLTMRSAVAGTAEAQQQLATSSKLVAEKFREISQATGLTITSMEQLDQAVKEGQIHYDQLTGTWVKGAADQAAATQASAATMAQSSGAALEEMKKQYQDYVTQVRQLQDQITDRQRSLYAELRDLARTGMSGVDAWYDQKKAAKEYETAARQAMEAADSAFSAGDTIKAGEKYKEAIAYADEAKNAYRALNTEVKNGDEVVVSKQKGLAEAMRGVESAGNLSIEVLKRQQAATQGAMNALSDKSGFADLTEGMNAAERAWLKNWETMRSFADEQIVHVEQKMEALTKDRWATVWITEKGAETVKGAYKQGGLIQALAAGGGVRNILGGGHLPGFGGGDRRLVLAEDGEVMINKYATRAAGIKAALAFNAGRFDVVMAELSKRTRANIGYRLGGMIGSLPDVNMQRLATGGQVLAPSSSAQPSKVVELRFAGGQIQGDERSVEMLLNHLEQAGLSA